MKLHGKITHKKGAYPLANVRVALVNDKDTEVASAPSGEDGSYSFSDIPEGTYKVRCTAFGEPYETSATVAPDHDSNVSCDMDIGLQITLSVECDCVLQTVAVARAGKRCVLSVDSAKGKSIGSVKWHLQPPVPGVQANTKDFDIVVPLHLRALNVEAVVYEAAAYAGAHTSIRDVVNVSPGDISMVQGDVTIQGRVALQEPVGVRLHRTASDPTLDQSFWVAIRNRTRALSFDRYQRFMNRALRWEERELPRGIQGRAAEELQRDVNELGTHLHGVSAYQTLKLLTETFLILECGVRIQREGERYRVPFDPEAEARRLGRPFTIEEMERKLKEYLGDRAQLPYITRVVNAAFPELEREGGQDRLIAARINEPCLIELIWSYWMEEGMLVQTMNAVSQRFQNVRGGPERDPLANLEIDPLRPLNNLLWGYIQDEYNRLSVRRRAYEYTHHYGLTLYGKATSGMRTADSRSKFLEAFHNLLYQTSIFFKEDFQTTVIADGFPLLNSLREVHLILAQGAQNQFGDLPWTARAEMLLTQFMLAQRPIHDFLQARVMVPYREPWEAQVDAMKTLQGWTDVTVSYFRDLAVYGEQLLLSIRYGDWIADNDEYSAINWARYFRPEIQGYLHAYRAVTGIDLTNSDTVDATIPGILLQKRMAAQRAR
jgi:hypothetical protein